MLTIKNKLRYMPLHLRDVSGSGRNTGRLAEVEQDEGDLQPRRPQLGHSGLTVGCVAGAGQRV